MSRARKQHFPLSHEQQRIWFLATHGGAGAAFNTPLAIELRGVLNTARLARALRAVTARHAALRTQVAVVDGTALQSICELVNAPLDIVDLSALEKDPQAAALDARLAADLAAPLPLQTAPLFRSALYLLSPERQLLHCVFHHLVFDADSAALFLRDLVRDYSGLAALPEAPAGYDGYVQWQQALLDSQARGTLLKYWSRQLHGIESLHTLPTDRPRAAVFSYAGATLREIIDAPCATALKRLAGQLRVTLFALMQTVFITLLHKRSGTLDVVIGAPASSRYEAGFADVIGMFSNMLVLRTSIDPKQKFSDLARLVQANTLDALEHQLLPFDLLVDHLQPNRDLSHAPLFQVAFAYHRVDTLAFDDGQLQARPFFYDGAFAKYDLQLSLLDDGNSISAHWEYSTDLYCEATVRAMMQQFHHLLGAISAQPELSIAHACRPATLAAAPTSRPAGQAASKAPAHEQTIPDAFAASAAQHREKPAIRFGEQQLSYAELDDASSAMAARLRRQGVQLGDVVSVMANSTPRTLVAILAVVKAGAAYLPLGMDWPASRMRSAMRQSGSTVLIAGSAQAKALTEVLLPLGGGFFASDDVLAPDAHPAAPLVPVLPDAPAYVIFTSGSTGVPKGVLASHRNVIGLFRNTQSLLQFSASDVWLLKHALTFDYSVWEMWGALLHGGTLIIPEEATAGSLSKLARLIADDAVTVLSVTPSFFGVFEHHLQSIVAASELRTILFSGEELPATLVASWLGNNSSTMPELWNLYGITENTVFTTAARLDNSVQPDTTVGIGQALPNHATYVLDDGLNPVAVNTGGELYLGGQGLTLGYIGAAALTAERFLPNPFAADGSRMYRSGDRVRVDRNGGLEYLGRNDRQIKLRGYRIDCSDVEINLEHCEMVRQARLVFVNSPAPELLAFITLTDAPPPQADALAWSRAQARVGAQLAARLPAFMLPGKITALREMPLTDNGKVDVDRLRQQSSRPAASARSVPADALTTTLLSIFARHLGEAALDANENFFAAGANSLMLLQIKDEVERSLGVEIALLDLFRYHTVALLADFLRAAPPLDQSTDSADRSDRRRAALARYAASPSVRPESG